MPSGVRAVRANDDLARRGYGDRGLEVRSGAARYELSAGAVRIAPCGAAIGALRDDHFVRALVRRGKTARVVPNDGEVLRVARIDCDLREVLAPDVQRLDALLRPAAEVAKGRECLIVDAHLDGPADAQEIGLDELLVENVRAAGVLSADDERRRTSADVRVRRAFERGRRRRSEEAAGVGVDVEYHTAVPGASVTVEGQRRVARSIVCVAERREVLEEWRLPIAPRDPAIEGIVEAAVVEADAAVVLAGDDVRPVGRVHRDLLLGLPA